MSPRPASPITRLDSRYPILWRDESTVQFGLEGIVSIDVNEPWVEPLLSRLRAGIRLASFDVIAHGLGAPRVSARNLLGRLRPVLIGEPKPAPPVLLDAVNVSDGRVPDRMRRALEDEGITLDGAQTHETVTVVVIEGAAAALQLAPYLRDDRAHLPVSFEDEAATVGPLVIPGLTPCLSCRDEHERRRDPAWPLLHAQLVGRSVTINSARIARVAALTARVLRTPRDHAGVMVRLSPDGRHVWNSVRHHEDCPCLDLSPLSRSGSATVPARLVRHCGTTR